MPQIEHHLCLFRGPGGNILSHPVAPELQCLILQIYPPSALILKVLGKVCFTSCAVVTVGIVTIILGITWTVLRDLGASSPLPAPLRLWQLLTQTQEPSVFDSMEPKNTHLWKPTFIAKSYNYLHELLQFSTLRHSLIGTDINQRWKKSHIVYAFELSYNQIQNTHTINLLNPI
jgi:hypothetical protein